MVTKKPVKHNHKRTKQTEESSESVDYEKRAEWNKKRGEFEEIADELSKDHDFLVLHDDVSREKFIKQNYSKQKDVKGIVKRAMELYQIRVKKFSI